MLIKDIASHPKLFKLLQRAYSAEKAASFAYQGHAGAVKNEEEKSKIRQIENDEWQHRTEVLKIMQAHDVPVSKYFEAKYFIIGKVISFSCYFIGWFMPFFFAGKLESGNVCEYFKMMQYFYELGITEHNEVLFEMGIKEKEHEIYFLDKIKDKPWLPFFQKLFSWGNNLSANDVNIDNKFPIEEARKYCKHQKLV